MPWSHKKAAWFGSDTVVNSSDDGTELALESLGSSQDLDSTHLRAQGHEAALKRSFSLLSALGLGFSITSSWVGYLSNFGQNLIYGGPRVVVFGLLIATVVQSVITLGLSEVASAFPSAGGQYHFTFILAPGPHKRMVPKITRAALFLAVSGFFVVFGLVLGLRRQTQPASFITQPGLGTSGWNAGTAWVLGVGNAMYAYGGIDAAIHIAEEIPQPGKNIPQAIGVHEPMGYLRSYGLGVRSRRIPYSKYFSHVSPSLDFPVRATVLSMTFCGFYGLIYLASSTAFNSIITSAVLYLSITYAIPQGIIVTRGRERSLPARVWNLGKAGYICNILSPLLITVIGTCLCFPPQLPVTTGNANYTPAILFGLFMVVLCFWYVRGHKFIGPKIDWELLNLTACR
ncbi:MAG: hypothetical protein Q9185_005930 [Variospora sp. 1 TL-2023]